MSATYTAYADFEVNDKQYQAGDKFTPPDDWLVDEQFVQLNQKNKGTPFFYTVQAGFDLDHKTGLKSPAMDTKRVILPVG